MYRTPRRRWGSLTRDAVIEGALELVDRDGLEALSMPRLARHLGTGVMTIYGHVANKADLVDALAERVLSEAGVIASRDGDWERDLAEWMRHLRQTVLRHPALGAVLAARGLTTPSVFQHLEAGVGLLRSAGFDRPTSVEIYYSLLTYTLGFLAWEIPRVHRQPEAGYAKQWADALAALPATEYPNLLDLAKELPNVASDGQFEAGLNALLRGWKAQKARD
jgi:TetR/AcrR family transcriptional regulator, tetracycline repressor protein